MLRTGFSGSILAAVLISTLANAGIVHVKVTSNSEARGYEAYRALDGNAKTLWHTEWQGSVPKHPHDLTIDLGKAYEVKGFVYLPRQGGGNGTIKDYAFYAANSLKALTKYPKEGCGMNRSMTYYASYVSLAPKFGFYSYGGKNWDDPKWYRTTPGEFGARLKALRDA
ncbi:discoidin domain-containing protein [Planctomycetota bacterium]